MSLLSALFGKLAPAPAERSRNRSSIMASSSARRRSRPRANFRRRGRSSVRSAVCARSIVSSAPTPSPRSTMRWRLRSPRRGRWSTCRASGCSEHDPEKACPGLDPGWKPVFRKDHAPPKKIRASIASGGGHCVLSRLDPAVAVAVSLETLDGALERGDFGFELGDALDELISRGVVAVSGLEKERPTSSARRHCTRADSVCSRCGIWSSMTSGMVMVCERTMRAPSSDRSRTRQAVSLRRLSK